MMLDPTWGRPVGGQQGISRSSSSMSGANQGLVRSDSREHSRCRCDRRIMHRADCVAGSIDPGHRHEYPRIDFDEWFGWAILHRTAKVLRNGTRLPSPGAVKRAATSIIRPSANFMTLRPRASPSNAITGVRSITTPRFDGNSACSGSGSSMSLKGNHGIRR